MCEKARETSLLFIRRAMRSCWKLNYCRLKYAQLNKQQSKLKFEPVTMITAAWQQKRTTQQLLSDSYLNIVKP